MKKLSTVFCFILISNFIFAQIQKSTEPGILNLNKPERVEWFK
jgi:hypothetical protein